MQQSSLLRLCEEVKISKKIAPHFCVRNSDTHEFLNRNCGAKFFRLFQPATRFLTRSWKLGHNYAKGGAGRARMRNMVYVRPHCFAVPPCVMPAAHPKALAFLARETISTRSASVVIRRSSSQEQLVYKTIDGFASSKHRSVVNCELHLFSLVIDATINRYIYYYGVCRLPEKHLT